MSERWRDVKTLWVTGFQYSEIQLRLGLTYTRVNHLMSEAKRLRKVVVPELRAIVVLEGTPLLA